MSTAIECFECGAPAECEHHVIPKSLGGGQTIPLCLKCHGIVHDRDLVTMKALSIEGKRRKKAARENMKAKKPQAEPVLSVYYGYQLYGNAIIEDPLEQEAIDVILSLYCGGADFPSIAKTMNEYYGDLVRVGKWSAMLVFDIYSKNKDNRKTTTRETP